MFSKKKFSSSVEYMVVGLGNPDKKYENTRHNTGFICLDKVAEKFGANVNRIKFKSLVGECTIGGKKVLLMKPQTYMNNSGQAVVEAMNFYKIPAENVVLIFDDISLDVGKMRIRRKGSDGGQNGVKNIIYLSGKDTFPRIKVGIGKKPHPDYDLAKWVLSKFSNDEIKLIDKMADNCCEALPYILEGNVDKAMNLFNS
ncbi:MAG: aminoacyl-tRNA hydrolase [Oscillospiraceae bacterium]|nr:aminoacyl-tRNA hydrolase [Oscillospiraceae bacterium]